MVRKGRLEEIFSRALHSDDDPSKYTVGYRDFERIVEVTLLEFVELSENFEVIPASRIVHVRRGSEFLYRKHKSTPR